MAEIIGFLRDDSATFGEKLVLKLLRQNLPKEFTVFVETPIHKKREIRYPDFIVLTQLRCHHPGSQGLGICRPR